MITINNNGFIRVINYTSLFFYLSIILLIASVFVKYGFDYATDVNDPKLMNMPILHGIFEISFFMLLCILIPLSFLCIIIPIMKKGIRVLKKEHVIFLIIHLLYLMEIFVFRSKITFWLAD